LGNVGRRKTAFVRVLNFKVESEKKPTAELAVRLGHSSSFAALHGPWWAQIMRGQMAYI